MTDAGMDDFDFLYAQDEEGNPIDMLESSKLNLG
jgi:hypothetical protein